MMKRHLLSVLFAACVLLSGCGTNNSPAQEPDSDSPAQEQPLDPSAGSDGSDDTVTAEKTLEDLCGEDYAQYIEETVLMQMENRMEKDPEIVYFPIREDRPLTDYAAIDETTAFTLDKNGNIVITFPAGAVTDAAHGEQTFRLPRP